MKLHVLFVAGLAGSLALGACADTSPVAVESSVVTAEARPDGLPNPSPKKGDLSIAELAGAAGFSILVDALEHVDTELGTGLVDLFTTTKDQYTVFAPTDDAFVALLGQLAALGIGDFAAIEDVPAPIVLDVLLYHVTEGRRAANSVVPKRNARTIETLFGETFAVQTDGTIEDGLSALGLPAAVRPDATIISPNNSASNGVVHGIDQVIVPPSVVAALTGG